MKTKSIGVILFILSLILFIIDNMIFGWNELPKSVLEGALDVVVIILCLISIYLMKK